MATRKPFVGGNWKSNGTVESAKELCRALKTGAPAYGNKVDCVLCPVTPQLGLIKKLVSKSPLMAAAQDVSATAEGAFTGEVSVKQLKDLGIHWTLVGHSERRTKYHETDEVTANKIEQCQKGNMSVIFCIGETLQEREAGKTNDVNKRMLDAVCSKITDWKKVVIAYEPVWAIGTGKVATPEQAQETHEAIRKMITSSVSEAVANQVRILYGGSVTTENCKDLIAKPDIDGFLVGGASLKPSFNEIITACVPAVPLKSPKFVKVNGIQPAAKGVNVYAKAHKTPEKAGDDIFEVVVGDETGMVTVRVPEAHAKTCKVGDTVRIQNAHVAMVKGFIRLVVDKWAVFKAADKEHEVASINEAEGTNISAVEYELTK